MELSRRLILKLKEEADAANAKLIVFSIPMLEQVMRPRPLPYREFRAFLDSNSIAGVDLFDDIAKLTTERRKALYMGDDAHLSDEGHRFFAMTALPRLQTHLATRSGSAIAGASQ